MRSAATFRSASRRVRSGIAPVGETAVDRASVASSAPLLRERIDQLALFFAQVPAPNHRQQVALLHRRSPKSDRPIVARLSQFDDLAGEAGVDVRHSVGVEDQCSRQFQGYRRRGGFRHHRLNAQ